MLNTFFELGHLILHLLQLSSKLPILLLQPHSETVGVTLHFLFRDRLQTIHNYLPEFLNLNQFCLLINIKKEAFQTEKNRHIKKSKKSKKSVVNCKQKIEKQVLNCSLIQNNKTILLQIKKIEIYRFSFQINFILGFLLYQLKKNFNQKIINFYKIEIFRNLIFYQIGVIAKQQPMM